MPGKQVVRFVQRGWNRVRTENGAGGWKWDSDKVYGGEVHVWLKGKNELQVRRLVKEYFDGCIEEKDGKQVVVTPMTLSGLAYALGCERRELVEYHPGMPYYDTIAAARQRVEQYVEEQLFSAKGGNSTIFCLKNNFHWKERPEETLEMQDSLEGLFREEAN